MDSMYRIRMYNTLIVYTYVNVVRRYTWNFQQNGESRRWLLYIMYTSKYTYMHIMYVETHLYYTRLPSHRYTCRYGIRRIIYTHDLVRARIRNRIKHYIII